MPRQRITFRIMRLLKVILPVVLILALATLGGSIWLAYWLAKAPAHPYLVTPEKFSHLSERGVRVTDETWSNKDGSQSRGWLLRGAVGAPAVLLLHRYGADRSWLLNLGVKLNEATNFTVLWPDMRGHGEGPLVKSTTFGTREADDAVAAIDYLATLKSAQGQKLVGTEVGIYGIELGSYTAVFAATRDASVRALVLDSVPSSPDQLVRSVVDDRTGIDSGLLHLLARGGMRLYLYNHYQNGSVCAAANSIKDRRVLLLAGGETGPFHSSTIALAQCFPNPTTVEVNRDLLITGFNLTSATSQQNEAYDRKVIEFFDKALREEKK